MKATLSRVGLNELLDCALRRNLTLLLFLSTSTIITPIHYPQIMTAKKALVRRLRYAPQPTQLPKEETYAFQRQRPTLFHRAGIE